MIRVEEVKVSATQVENAIELPLLTCMYLGDRWECLFERGGGADNLSLRAYSRHKLEAGKYWLHMPADKLWVF
jgi:iron(III) transport system ATP-binding protein